MSKLFYLVMVYCCFYISVSRASETLSSAIICHSGNTEIKITYFKATKLKGYDRIIAMCHLSFLGDHRAQYQLSKYYLKQDTPESIKESYIWVLISNSWYQQSRKTRLIKQIESQLSDSLKQKLVELANDRYHLIGGSIEINQINRKIIIRKRRPIGSNILRTEKYIREKKPTNAKRIY